MTMTLTEYLNQKKAERMPDVHLQEGEYRIGSILLHRDSVIRQIFINKWPLTEYVQIGDDKRLYTTDSHGNPKSKSCFIINQ